MLNDAQRQAVELVHPRIACVAGPGTGKTRGLTERIVRLLQNGVPGHRILAFTFTRKAAAELLGRVQTRLAEDGIEGETPEVSTVHTWAASIVRAWPEAANRTAAFTVYDEQDTERLLRDVGAKDRTHPEYQERLRAADAVDFEGLEEAAVAVLKAHTADVRRRYDHVLLDEAQDSSAFETSLLSLLDPPNLFIVGDDNQRVYSFRGAGGEILAAALTDPRWTTVELTENYRSLETVVAWTNALADTWIGGTTALTPVRGPGGSVTVSTHATLVDRVRFLQDRFGDGGVAVLGRTWKEVLRAEHTLRRAGVRIAQGGAGAVEFTRRVSRFLRLCLNHHDDNLAGWLAEDELGLPAESIRAEAIRARSSVLELVGRSYWSHRAKVETILAAKPTDKAADLVERWFPGAHGFVGVLRAFDMTVSGFGAWSSRREDTAEAAGTLCMTIHGSKGLEWPAVVVVGCSARHFPAGDPEEARVLYVAATRARDELVLLYDDGIDKFSRRCVPPSPLLGQVAAVSEAPAWGDGELW